MNEVFNDNIIIEGEGACDGGTHPDPPIHDYPLLVCINGVVHTEDGRATARAIAYALSEHTSIDAPARRFGTTIEHCRQAIEYAMKANMNRS